MTKPSFNQQQAQENKLSSYTVYYTDFFEGDDIGDAKSLGSFFAQNDVEATEKTKTEFNIPSEAVLTYDIRTYFSIYKGSQEAFWCVEKNI